MSKREGRYVAEPVEVTVLYSLDEDPPTILLMAQIPLDRYSEVIWSMGTKSFAQNMVDGIGAALVGREMDIGYTERNFIIEMDGEPEE